MSSSSKITNFFNLSPKKKKTEENRDHREKRKLSSTSSSVSDCSPVVPPGSKRQNVQSASDISEPEEASSDMDNQALLAALEEKLRPLATKEDTKGLSTKIDKLEGQLFEISKLTDSMTEEIGKLKEENKTLRERLSTVEAQQNESEQYDRRWNLRVFNIAERSEETVDQCAERCCQLFSEELGVKTVIRDLEAAHRVGKTEPGRKRPRPIVVRFQSRRLRDQVLAERKKLKGKGISVGEDLTYANYQLERAAFRHSATLATWTSNGKVFVKLKNGKTMKLKFGDNVDTVLKKAM